MIHRGGYATGDHDTEAIWVGEDVMNVDALELLGRTLPGEGSSKRYTTNIRPYLESRYLSHKTN